MQIDPLKSTTGTATAKATAATALALNRCIEVSVDAEKGYALAAASVRDPALRARLHEISRQRGEFVIALQDAVASLGVFAENEGSFRGALHRAATGVRLAVGGRSDAAVLEECKRGEFVAQETYERALAELGRIGVPAPIRKLLEAQHESIARTSAEIQP
jgi:uncharacterized protein (TIGR02284 family)